MPLQTEIFIPVHWFCQRESTTYTPLARQRENKFSTMHEITSNSWIKNLIRLIHSYIIHQHPCPNPSFLPYLFSFIIHPSVHLSTLHLSIHPSCPTCIRRCTGKSNEHKLKIEYYESVDLGNATKSNVISRCYSYSHVEFPSHLELVQSS